MRVGLLVLGLSASFRSKRHGGRVLRRQSVGRGPALGFTLIEIMVVVAIVAILAAVAIPSYTAYVQRGRIVDALRSLGSMQPALEQYFLDNRTYVGACGVGAGTAPLPQATAYFNFRCPTLSATNYEVRVDGLGSMAGFSYSLVLTNGAIVRQTNPPAPAGWTVNQPSTCWVIKPDGSC